jgi:transposase
MALSYSRQIFLRFFLDARMENFLRGHVAAFTAWNGVPRVLLYDNLKSVVWNGTATRSASIPHY